MTTGKFCQYGKEIKKRLVDIDHSQSWLIDEVKAKTGLFVDSSYLYKIMTGQNATPKIVAAINEILEISVPETESA